MHLTAERARELFEYVPGTGQLFRKARDPGEFKSATAWKIWATRFLGTEASLLQVKGNGYRRMRVFADGHFIMAHRLIWLMMTGSLPFGEIDHIDRDATNNKWENLREAGDGNQRNKSLQRNNKSGVSGVSWCKQRSLWHARVWSAGKVYQTLGYFNCLEQAEKVVLEFRKTNGYSVGHGLKPCYEVLNAS